MIRRELFVRLGGFDRRYAPAYYEDVDLCLRVREAGHRVIVQPLARLIHVEGGTAGRDPDEGIKRHQEINRARLAERWSERLRNAPAPVRFGISHFVLPGQRRVVIIDHVVPAADEDAGSVILLEIIKLLQQLGYSVVLGAQQTPNRRDREVMALERLGVEVIRAPYYRSVVEYLSVHDGQFDLIVMVRHAIAEQILPQLDRLARAAGHHPAQSGPALPADRAGGRDPRGRRPRQARRERQGLGARRQPGCRCRGHLQRERARAPA